MRKVLSALKGAQLAVAGRGTAIMATENYRKDIDGKELVVDFVFKGQTSRTDIFESRGGDRGTRLFARVVSDRHVIRLDPGSAHISRPQGRGDRDLGLDFHPEVFTHFEGIALTKWLEGFLEHPPDYTSAKVDDEGILHIIARAPVVIPKTREQYNNEMRFSFDTQKGLLPVLCSTRYIHAEPNKGWSAEIEYEWAKYDSTWYIRRAEYSVRPSNKDHRVITVKNFTPHVEEKEFTLDGMGLVDGTRVFDKIAGVNYRYEAPIRFIEEPETAQKEADFIRKIREEQSSLTGQTDVGAAQLAGRNGLYLRDYQTGRLIGPISLTPGYLLPVLDGKEYIVAGPAQSELDLRKRLLESKGYESHYIDIPPDEVVETINMMLKHRLGDKAPLVRVEAAAETKLPLITMDISGDEPAYNVLCNIAARAKLRIFVEDGAVILGQKPLKELAGKTLSSRK
jgi:hypothetical protein